MDVFAVTRRVCRRALFRRWQRCTTAEILGQGAQKHDGSFRDLVTAFTRTSGGRVARRREPPFPISGKLLHGKIDLLELVEELLVGRNVSVAADDVRVGLGVKMARQR